MIGESSAGFNRLIYALTRSHEVESRVADFTATMSTQLELKPLCDGALASFLAATEAAAGAVLADVGGQLSVLATFGMVEAGALCENDHVRLAMQTREPVYVELPEGLVVHAGLVAFQPREVVFLPLDVRSVSAGVVVLASSALFDRDTRPLAQIFARTFAVALSNAMTHDHLQRIAALDPLTNCYNRRFGFGRLREEFTRAARHETPLGLILFDIDHFKSVNDTYGHLVGDRVVAAVAKTAKQRLREGDVLVRYGGEEFVCILPGASAEDALVISERIRRAVEELVVQDRDQAIRCTVSLGYTSYPGAAADDETAMIQIVDDALYRAKDSGRNRALQGPA